MKKLFLKITLASLVTLVVYLLCQALINAILHGLDDRLILLTQAILTTFAYAFFLLYFLKIRKGEAEKEVLEDYTETEYPGMKADLKNVWKKEKAALIMIFIIIISCFVLNIVDTFLLPEWFISLPTIIYMPMCFFALVLEHMYIIGYILSAVAICVIYILVLLVYRRRLYKYWLQKNNRT